MCGVETFERGEDDVLPFAEFELSARENHETVFVQAAAGRGVEQAVIDSLMAQVNRPDGKALQIIGVPARDRQNMS